MTMIEKILGRERVLITEQERVVHLWKGQVQGILGPGEHMLASRKDRLELEWHNLERPAVLTKYDKAIFDKLPDVAATHFTEIRTGRTEVAVVERDGKIDCVIGPDQRRVFWTDAGPWRHTIHDVVEKPQIDEKLARRLKAPHLAGLFTAITVEDGQAGLVSFDGALEHVLKPGLHAFWTAGRTLQHKIVELKRQVLDVPGQEVLTLDRVTLRVTIAATFQVIDPVKAVMEVKDFHETLYRALQLAFRKTIGAMTLDRILEQKVSIDEKAAKQVKADMAAIGVDVSEIALKDVILPGEMRDILNKVVTAEKEAEANVIRRREETNATRSLLNTAKVMADNPVMLRLKELEALETIAGRVDTITVHSGTDGLMNDLVKLRDK